MRYLIELPNSRAHAVAAAVAHATETLGREVGVVAMETLVMGAMHELGVISALTMAGVRENADEIAYHLKGLSGMAGVYLQALVSITSTPDQEQANESAD